MQTDKQKLMIIDTFKNSDATKMIACKQDDIKFCTASPVSLEFNQFLFTTVLITINYFSESPVSIEHKRTQSIHFILSIDVGSYSPSKAQCTHLIKRSTNGLKVAARQPNHDLCEPRDKNCQMAILYSSICN